MYNISYRFRGFWVFEFQETWKLVETIYFDILLMAPSASPRNISRTRCTLAETLHVHKSGVWGSLG